MKKLHQYLGLVMLAPFIAWAITGVFFFVKPGYKDAYASLSVKTYPLLNITPITPQENWQEIRWLRTILGEHLLVKTDKHWQQLNPTNLKTIEQQTEQQTRLLIEDAIQTNPARYGKIESIDGQTVLMDSGVTINVNWPQMRLYQSGSDTDFINWMYKVHYLQWTGIQSVDRVLGIVGLGLVVLLAGLGLSMVIKRRRDDN